MQARMRILDAIAKSMDRLILSYRDTPEGDAVGIWKGNQPATFHSA